MHSTGDNVEYTAIKYSYTFELYSKLILMPTGQVWSYLFLSEKAL